MQQHPSNMATFKRLFSRKSSPAAPRAAMDEPQPLPMTHSAPGASCNGGGGAAAGELPRKARWQTYDFSDCVYDTQTHPVGRSHSRKLSDLPPLADLSPPLEADAAGHQPQQLQLQQQQLSKLGPRGGGGAARLTDDEVAPLDVAAAAAAAGAGPIAAASG